MPAKQKLIEKIAAEVVDCRKCRLYMSAKNGVPGEGKAEATLIKGNSSVFPSPLCPPTTLQQRFTAANTKQPSEKILKKCGH